MVYKKVPSTVMRWFLFWWMVCKTQLYMITILQHWCVGMMDLRVRERGGLSV